MTRKIIIAVGFLLMFLLGIWAARWYFLKSMPTETEQSTILLEKVKTVTKLITVEGYFSEIYDYKDYYHYDWSPFRKKALLRVKAKVSIGYDLENMKFEALPDQKILRISQMPDPSILSIDHDVDYYDLQQGTFNSFTPKDYTKLNKNAKEYIEAKALESDLMKTAESQVNTTLKVIQFMVEEAGWELEITPKVEKEEAFPLN